MTHQTAAALRALYEQMNCHYREFAANSPALGAHVARWRDELAAVLTQEGAESWRCFHCDETFTTDESAREHFGASLSQHAACQIDIAEHRRMEEKLQRYCEEDTELHREILRLNSAHAVALRQEEEKGYARGLRDARADAPAEPRAAEGAGTLGPSLANVVEDASGLGSEILPAQAVPERYLSRPATATTAAIVGYLVSPNARAHPNAKEQLVFDKPICRPDWNVFPLTLAEPTAAAAVPAGGDALPKELDRMLGVWWFWPDGRHIRDTDVRFNGTDTTGAKRLEITGSPAPRGGVTEAAHWKYVCDLLVAAGIVQSEKVGQAIAIASKFHAPGEYMVCGNQPSCGKTSVVWTDDGDMQCAECGHPMSPAAQAQDAGPMARHWRIAFHEWRVDEIGSANESAIDTIEERARALAAKEAK